MKTNISNCLRSALPVPWQLLWKALIALAVSVTFTDLYAQSTDAASDRTKDGDDVSVPESWIPGASLPSLTTRAVGVYFPANGLFYAMGGRASDVAGSNFTHPFEYNPTANTWTTKVGTYPDINVNNMACGVLTVGGTPQIYCVGGSAGGGTTATGRVFIYNPATDVVTPLGSDDWPGNTGAVLPGGFAVVANKLYIVGGFNINVASTSQTWQFDPNAAIGSRWLQRLDMPVPRSYVPTAVIGGMIYTAGGSNIVTTTVTDTADSFKYDPVANTWTSIPNIPRATGETRALALNNQMWVLGGGRTAPNPSTQVDVFTPDRNQWSLGVPFTTARRNFPADTDGSRVWLAGGYDTSGTTLLMTMERFQIPTAQSAVSRKMHGVNTFDVPLPLSGTAGVESRRGGGAGFNTHQAIVTFATNVTVAGVAVVSSDSMATGTQSVAGAVVTVNLSGVTDAQTIMITLINVNDGTSSGDVTFPMAVLRGDTNGDRFVNSGDALQTRGRSGQAVDATNFRSDINADGALNSGDTLLVRANAGAFVP